MICHHYEYRNDENVIGFLFQVKGVCKSNFKACYVFENNDPYFFF